MAVVSEIGSHTARVLHHFVLLAVGSIPARPPDVRGLPGAQCGIRLQPAQVAPGAAQHVGENVRDRADRGSTPWIDAVTSPMLVVISEIADF